MPDQSLSQSPDRYTVPALERGLRLLGEFSRQSSTLSAPELARRLDLPRSTIFRMLSTLESAGFVERVDEGRSYRLGLAVLRLGFEYLASLELTQLGTPLLRQFCEATGYACNLVVRDGRSIVYVAKVAPSTPFSSSVSVGTRLPAHGTVLGRVLLQDMSLAQLKGLYPEDKLEVFSPRTPKTVKALHDLLQADRARGYVLAEGFFEGHISTIAAPVRDASGTVVAAMGTTIPSDHIEKLEIDGLVERIRASAMKLSVLLNYVPASS